VSPGREEIVFPVESLPKLDVVHLGPLVVKGNGVLLVPVATRIFEDKAPEYETLRKP
jgi:hypothetical protein